MVWLCLTKKERHPKIFNSMEDKNSAFFNSFAEKSSKENEKLFHHTELKNYFISQNCSQLQIEQLIRESSLRLDEENKNVEETAEKVLKEFLFKYFLQKLDFDESGASEKYIVLHLKIVKKLTWDGCPEYEAETLADKVIDVVARKINEIEQKLAKGITEENGKVIKEIGNINSYALEVARLISLEYYRKHQSKRVDTDDLPEVAKVENLQNDADERLDCLRDCLLKLPEQKDRELIVAYYDTGDDEKNKEAREKLRVSLGLSKSNLKKKVCLLRQKLEKCINNCLTKSA